MSDHQLFRQYPEMNGRIFIKYLKCLKRKFKKFIFYYDGAPYHRSKEVLDFFEKSKDWLLPIRFPKCSPEFNATEECWRQGKESILGSFVPSTFKELKNEISTYYRTKKFHLDIVKYLCP